MSESQEMNEIDAYKPTIPDPQLIVERYKIRFLVNCDCSFTFTFTVGYLLILLIYIFSFAGSKMKDA